MKEEELRVRLPKGNEMFAIVEQRLGANKMYVRCQDNKIRIARVPGRFSKRLWIREGDLVLVVPWIVQSDKKCDIVHKYKAVEKEWLAQKGILPEDMK